MKASAETFADSITNTINPTVKIIRQIVSKTFMKQYNKSAAVISLGIEPGIPIGLIANSGARWLWCNKHRLCRHAERNGFYFG